MKQIHHTNNGNEFLFVELPEGAGLMNITEPDSYGDMFLTYQMNGETCYESLPEIRTVHNPINYEILGKVSELTKEQKQEMVEQQPLLDCIIYKNYARRNSWEYIFHLAFKSLLTHLKITPGNWIALKLNRE